MGIIDFDQGFDNEFQQFKLIMKLMVEVKEAINQKTLDFGDNEKLLPDKEVETKLDKIWNGNCFLLIKRNEDGSRVIAKKFAYDIPDDDWDEIIPLPKLRNMIPINQLADDTWGIQIREAGTLKVYWEGADWGTIVNDGHFAHYTSEGTIPRIESWEIDSIKKKTTIIHRPVYHKLMEDFTINFQELWAILANNYQRIIDYVDSGIKELDELEAENKLLLEKKVKA